MGAVPAVKSDIETIAGVVTKVDASAIEVGTDNNETTSVMVDASTLYRKWILAKPWQQDQRANANDVQVGMRVRIDVAKDNPRIAETVWPESAAGRKAFFSALWQADNHKIHRMAPIEFVGRYLDGFFDYGIADEVHELKSGDTAQGNAFGVLAAACNRTIVLTGTLLGGYADELFHILYRLDSRQMREDGLLMFHGRKLKFRRTVVLSGS